MTTPVALYPDHLRDVVDEHLAQLTFSADSSTDGLAQAMRYSLLAGGKRIRPVLALATAQAIGREATWALPYAAALELIHTYSLIHDDLPAMDDDDLRRGQPTCHVAYGEPVAILAGDALYAEAMRHVLTHQRGHVVAALRELTAATGVDGMVGGQYIDVTAGGAVSLRRLHALKTGRLIGAAVEGVLQLHGTDELDATVVAALREYAGELGVLFQIVDDILDVTGTDVALGKPRGSDERHGKRTYVTEHGLDGARALADASHEQARSALARAGAADAELEQITDFIFTRSS